MADKLVDKYFFRRGSGSATDVTTLFHGLRVLSITGFQEMGDSVNVFTQQWKDSQTEDFLVTTQDDDNNDIIIRQNVDIQMTIIISGRYYNNTDLDVAYVYDELCEYLNGGDFYITSDYDIKTAHVICLKGFKPTVRKLHRGKNSYIMATIPLHVLNMV